MGYGLDGPGLIPDRERFFSSPQHPDLLFNGYQGQFLQEYSGWGVKLTAHLHLVLGSRMVEQYLHSPYVILLN
jgi:hypothetical protein